jgi:hypothetical protein
MIELDSANTLEDQQPRTHMQLANFTFVHRNANSSNNSAMLFRGKADATLVNGVVAAPNEACLRLSGANILTADSATGKRGPPVFQSVVMQCANPAFVDGTGVTAQQASDAFSAGSPNNSAAFTTSLTGTYVNGANETGVTATDPKTQNAAYDTTTYVGAANGTDTWYAGWTCNSATADFGTTSKACTSIPPL